ncbi:MAG: MerR family transcriptional regulator [Clostridia bacterium]|nr:MerR family transcriptional regulator [Clostridia bacterium]
MMKIGDFAKLCHVSSRTLRFYDDAGILCAAKVDHESGYRYYLPEQIKTFENITMWKEIGFSLEEIKCLLKASSSEASALYAKKKQHLVRRARHIEEKIRQLDCLCGIDSIPSMPLNPFFLHRPFENDPDAVGKWSLCGVLPHYREGRPLPDPGEAVPSRYLSYPILYFLPEGQCYWNFAWSRGVFFRMSERYNLILRNDYRITEGKDGTYMILHWFGDECLEGESGPYYLLYRKEDSHPYSELDTHTFRDDVTLPFVSDPDIHGSWRTLAYLSKDEEWDPDRPPVERPVYLRRLEVFPDGTAIKTLGNLAGTFRTPRRYTKGLILNERDACAEHYEIRAVKEKTYLLLDHKSGDYQFTGAVYGYFVLEKETES